MFDLIKYYKNTSNAFLTANGYWPISFRTVDSMDYKKAMRMCCEQHNIAAFQENLHRAVRVCREDIFLKKNHSSNNSAARETYIPPYVTKPPLNSNQHLAEARVTSHNVTIPAAQFQRTQGSHRPRKTEKNFPAAHCLQANSVSIRRHRSDAIRADGIPGAHHAFKAFICAICAHLWFKIPHVAQPLNYRSICAYTRLKAESQVTMSHFQTTS